jgi:hypothetical protein
MDFKRLCDLDAPVSRRRSLTDPSRPAFKETQTVGREAKLLFISKYRISRGEYNSFCRCGLETRKHMPEWLLLGTARSKTSTGDFRGRHKYLLYAERGSLLGAGLSEGYALR